MNLKRSLVTGAAALMLLAGTTVPAGAATVTTDALQPASTEAAAAYTKCAATTPKAITTGSTAWVPAVKTRGSISCVLYYDTSGYNPAVYRLQESLQAAEKQGIALDGYYGPGTKAAVIRVQKKYGLVQDGSYGPNTGRAMLWKGANGSIGRWK